MCLYLLSPLHIFGTSSPSFVVGIDIYIYYVLMCIDAPITINLQEFGPKYKSICSIITSFP